MDADCVQHHHQLSQKPANHTDAVVVLLTVTVDVDKALAQNVVLHLAALDKLILNLEFQLLQLHRLSCLLP